MYIKLSDDLFFIVWFLVPYRERFETNDLVLRNSD